MNEVTLKVKGMKCGGCVESVQSALSAVPGVQEAEVSLEDAEARVMADDAVSVAALSAAVASAGFEVTGTA